MKYDDPVREVARRELARQDRAHDRWLADARREHAQHAEFRRKHPWLARIIDGPVRP